MIHFKNAAITLCALALLPVSTSLYASGVVPETSVVIIEQGDGEGSINIKNTDTWPVLLLTTIENLPDDEDSLLTVTPPAARVEPGKTQHVRFMMTAQEPLKVERLKRAIFEGVPPQVKGKNEVRMTVRQNLPLLIRPAGLERDMAPWKKLEWHVANDGLSVSNPSPYVVRLGQAVQTLPDNTTWMLPGTYVLPGQTLTLTNEGGAHVAGSAKEVRISPATTWGYTVNSYDAALAR
ncbi:fimbria/pilus chaperone family protein [Burkholderia pyrrocinia]|uniref:fimbria/pilus chaperone family protein n=1 Tax=Burkholderia pyrrocinia TaxID=60550 RepID=UPI0010506E54|nr:fimbria/pilus chaperone family protein [Burkholderia pyrrocinia]TDA48292.1 fimbrial protein [Burkholderia pyrrocinia]